MTQETMILGKIFMFQAVPFCFLYNPANSFISKGRCKITKSSYKIQIYSHSMVILSVLLINMIGSRTLCVLTRNNKYKFGYNKPSRFCLIFYYNKSIRVNSIFFYNKPIRFCLILL